MSTQKSIKARIMEIKVGDQISFVTGRGAFSGIVASRKPQYTQHTHFTLDSGESFIQYSGDRVIITK